MPITRRITSAISRSLTSAVTGGVISMLRPGFFRKDPLLAGSVVPFGTSAINEATATGTTSRTLSIDSAVTFNGRPTTKLVITGAGSNKQMEVGTTAATVTLSAEAQAFLTQHMCFAVKTDGANEITGGVLFAGDGTYANYYNISMGPVPTVFEATGTTVDGWTIFERIQIGASATVGAPNLAATSRVKLRLTTVNNVAAGTVWLAFAGILPPPVPTVVFTCDDGFSEWTWLATEAKARGIPISFGVSYSLLNTAGFLTDAEVQAIGNDPSGLFEITNHAQNNDSYSTLGLAAYVTAVENCKDYIVNTLGLDPYPAQLHQYVQGIYDQALIDELQSRGYHGCRAVGPSNRSAANLVCGLQPDQDELFRTLVACSLTDTENLATVQTRITNAATAGTAFIMGHAFKAAAAPVTWIAGYDANYGVLNLLDWLAQKRDTEGWRIMLWSDWRRSITAGGPPLIHS